MFTPTYPCWVIIHKDSLDYRPDGTVGFQPPIRFVTKRVDTGEQAFVIFTTPERASAIRDVSPEMVDGRIVDLTAELLRLALQDFEDDSPNVTWFIVDPIDNHLPVGRTWPLRYAVEKLTTGEPL